MIYIQPLEAIISIIMKVKGIVLNNCYFTLRSEDLHS